MKNRSIIIDFLKVICIVLVIITHSGFLDEQRITLGFPFWIDMAVPIFMIISGYLWTKSNIKNSRNGIKELYNFEVIVNKLVRFVIPFVIVFFMEEVANVVIDHDFNILKILYRFFTGGTGPGSYYTPIMIQFVLLFPLIYIYMKKTKSKQKSLFILFLINLIYEIIIYWCNIPTEIYRLLIFRYIFVIAWGTNLALITNKLNKKEKILNLVSLLLGIAYIIVVVYNNIDIKIIKYWKTTSVFTILYIGPIINYIILKFSNIDFLKNHNKTKHFIEEISNATFHIFLVQMLYYNFYIVKKVVDLPYVIPINIIICIVCGIAFYEMESKISKRVLIKK